MKNEGRGGWFFWKECRIVWVSEAIPLSDKPTRNMNTNAISVNSLSDYQLDVLVVKAVQLGCEGVADVEKQLYPMPHYPSHETPQAVAEWREADAKRNLAVYGLAGGRMAVPYGETLSSRVTGAFIRMTKAGRIREHISGWGFSTYSFIR